MLFKIEPLKPEPGKKINVGAIVTGLDVNQIDDEGIAAIKEAAWKYKILIIKGQRDLQPIEHWEFVCRLDKEAPNTTHDLYLKDFHPKGKGLLETIGVNSIPGAENIHLIGKGYQGDDHYGLKAKMLDTSGMRKFQSAPIPEEEFQRGFTRFHGWHLDAPMYSRNPSQFTGFQIIRLPKGPPVTIRWDDGSGLTMPAAPGRTPMFCCSQLYEECLTDEEKALADHSWVEYQGLPFEWTKRCKTNPNGLGHLSQSQELSEEEMNALGVDPDKVMKYPMVWVNPSTGRKSFMVHCFAARRLFLRRSLEHEPTVVEDITEIRSFVNNIYKRILKPEYILVPPEEDGDLLLWDNWSTMHTRVDYPDSYGPKTCHQATPNARHGPVGPVPIPLF